MAPRKNLKVGDKCSRCASASILISRDETFCHPCFLRFLSTKLRRQTDNYKVQYNKTKQLIPSRSHVLIPLYDISATNFTSDKGPENPKEGANLALLKESNPWSTQDLLISFSLIHQLVALLQDQRIKHRGNQGFYIHVIHITNSHVREGNSALDLLKAKYPNHEIESYHTLNLLDIENSSLPGELSDLFKYLSVLDSKSSKTDALQIYMKYMLVQLAQSLNPISEDDNGSKWEFSIFVPETVELVAQRILASISKGRINQIYADFLPVPSFIQPEDQTQNGNNNIGFTWPLKDIKYSEVLQYLQLEWPESLKQYLNDEDKALLDSLFSTNGTPSQNDKKDGIVAKQMSIDTLIRAYFKDIDESFPSVATTVVRTIEKLVDPVIIQQQQDGIQECTENCTASECCGSQYNCSLCGCTKSGKELAWISKITVNEGADVSPVEIQSGKFAASTMPKDDETVLKGLCYGCLVMLKDSILVKKVAESDQSDEDQLSPSPKASKLKIPHWSTSATDSVNNTVSRNNNLKSILAEYEL